METINDRIEACIIRSAKRTYQEDILRGRARLSGADLKGKAMNWSAQYSRSRGAAVKRFRDAIQWEFGGRLAVGERRSNRGLRYLVIYDVESGKVLWTA